MLIDVLVLWGSGAQVVGCDQKVCRDHGQTGVAGQVPPRLSLKK